MSESTVPPTSHEHAPRPSLFRRALGAVCWLYLAFVLIAWLVMRQFADRWWPATLIAFGPRWLFALPLVPLAPLTLLVHRRAIKALAPAALIALVPLADLCLPWRTLAPARDAATLRVLTCNVDHRALNADAMAQLIAANRPDVVAFQEWTSAHESTLFRDGHWYTLRDDELFVASRYPIRRAEDVGAKWRNFAPGVAVRYEITDTPAGTIDLYNVHLESPHPAFDAVVHLEPEAPAAVQANSDHRRRQLEDLAASLARRTCPALLAGDFNTPDDTPAFRYTLSPLARDAFATAGTGYGHTYHLRWTQTRIDHLLATPAWRIRHCHVAPNVGSAHRPLVADFQLLPSK